MAAFIVVCVLVSVLARQRPVDCSVLSVHQVYLALLLDALVLETLEQDEYVAEVRQAFLAYLALSYKTRSSWASSSTRRNWRCVEMRSSSRTSASRTYTRYTWCC